MDREKFRLLVTVLFLSMVDLTVAKTLADASDGINIQRVARQADFKLKNHGDLSSNSSIEGRYMTEGKAQHDVSAKGKASGGFELGLGLSGLTLSGTGDATGHVDSKGNLASRGQADTNAKTKSGGVLGSILNGGLFFPDLLGKYAPEDDNLRQKREPRFKRQLDMKAKGKSELGGEVGTHGRGMAEGNAQHELHTKGGVNGGFGIGFGLSGLTLTGNADVTGEVSSKGGAGGRSQVEGGAEGKSKGLIESMFGSGFIFGKRKKRDTDLYAVQFLDTHINNTLSTDNVIDEIQNEIPFNDEQIFELLALITGNDKNSYSKFKKFNKSTKTDPIQIILILSMEDKNGKRIKRQVETDKVSKLVSRLGQYNLQAWQIDEMLRDAPPQRRKQILQNYAPEILDINPQFLNRYENI